MIYVLVQAGEGDIGTLLVGHSKEDLITKLELEFQEEIDNYSGLLSPAHEQNAKDLTQSELDALRMMLNNSLNKEWRPGRYVLENIEPIWQEWTLYIPETDEI